MTLTRTQSTDGGSPSKSVDTVFATRYTRSPIPKYEFPTEELPQKVAAQIIADQLQLDGKPRLNVASFVTTWMEPEAEQLMQQAMAKNAIDLAEYPASSELQGQCVNMVARLFHAPLQEGQEAVGTATVGSSEGCHLACLALKRRWKHWRTEKGLPSDKPNLICGANTHVVVKKFANYFDVELREVSVTRDCLVMDPARAVEACDENTIGVVVIFGSTYTGHFEDVKQLNDQLAAKNEQEGWNIAIHVDAASGGFVAPFLYPDLEWDFRLPLVKSINVSGHKYGLTYPGVGWVVWRTSEDLPQDLIFHVSYLGEDQPTFTLNFSKGASQIVGQYYQFIRLGFEGYKRVMSNVASVASFLRSRLEATKLFVIHSPRDMGVPLVAFSFDRNSEREEARVLSERTLSDAIRRYGWILPAYNMPPDMEELTMLRINVREDLSQGLADFLVNDLLATVDNIMAFRRDIIDTNNKENGKIDTVKKHPKGHTIC
eukprot:jgi/Mesen1/9141/ME000058S08626